MLGTLCVIIFLVSELTLVCSLGVIGEAGGVTSFPPFIFIKNK